MLKKPNLFLLGAAKSGTTSLDNILRRSTDICASDIKETHFFEQSKNYNKGVDWYIKNYYSHYKGEKYILDSTPYYFHLPDIVIDNFKKTFCLKEISCLKFIIVLRDPVERAISHYLHKKRVMQEELSLIEAMRRENDRLRSNRLKWQGYYSDGLYDVQLKSWFDHFDKNQFLIFTTDELRDNYLSVMKLIEGFLEVKINRSLLDEKYENKASEPRSKLLMYLMTNDNVFKQSALLMIPYKIRKKLSSFLISSNLKPVSNENILTDDEMLSLRSKYLPHIEELEGMIGKNLSKWK